MAVIFHNMLGIKKGEIVTQSIRSGALIVVYLGEHPVYTIMMIGCWSSDTFLCYISKQFKQFSHNISLWMLNYRFC
ncbi:hypothetical protein ACHAXS_005959 [Conticribra weissflogii]